MIKDPVCCMEVENTQLTFEYEGKKYFFCSQGCLDKFKLSPRDFSNKYHYDLVIVGAGPAGLTAAVHASIFKIDTFVITKDIGGQAVDSAAIKNYMGFDFISGKELIEKFERQFLEAHYLVHKIDEVTKIDRKGDSFEVLTKSKDRILTHAVLIASGMKRRSLGIPGEERLLRKGVTHNLVHDVTLYKGLSAVVIGGGNSGVQTANELKKVGAMVTLVSKGKLIADQAAIDELGRGKSVQILEGYDVIEIQGRDSVESIVVGSRRDSTQKVIACKVVFVQVGFMPNTEFCREIVDFNRKGEVKINPDCSTSTAGIFACGDVTNCFGKRIIIASGEGAKAALSAKNYLLNKKP
ncbi:MAG: FAD-dependent oxidoreductase [Candidatus Omnitrophica bacterium]|nr:FAD-dependent oxidoreductase [Candidatus Omnitrophota bacterium]MDD5236164.1 FAD-dependent oxidoreductase [Candidatus Omnitrophota bacterium]MDD5610940.1 FAD-dependent oxidoreductase [Candidatus Omnitrophota bacterium]